MEVMGLLPLVSLGIEGCVTNMCPEATRNMQAPWDVEIARSQCKSGHDDG